jgi:hypothetical protein
MIPRMAILQIQFGISGMNLMQNPQSISWRTVSKRGVVLTNQPFSKREGHRGDLPLIYDAAPVALRSGLREVLQDLGHKTPSQQRRILCGAFRVLPDSSNWSEYPNIDREVSELLETEPWYLFFDALERVPKYLDGTIKPYHNSAATYHTKLNLLFAEERIGYRFEGGRIIRVGTEAFHNAVAEARHALQDERFVEVLQQFERACDFRDQIPPDWSNAIKEAVNSVEGLLQVLLDRPRTSLSKIPLPAELPNGINKMFQALYVHGTQTRGSRHAGIGGDEPTGPRAELALHIAAALHAFAVAELDPKQGQNWW